MPLYVPLMGLTFGMLTSCSDDLDVHAVLSLYGGDDAGSHTYCEG